MGGGEGEGEREGGGELQFQIKHSVKLLKLHQALNKRILGKLYKFYFKTGVRSNEQKDVSVFVLKMNLSENMKHLNRVVILFEF